jgi:hypothetical protein
VRYDNAQQLNYRELLRRVHEEMRPRAYLEIGIHYGYSLHLAQPGTRIIGVDPRPDLKQAPPADTQVIEETSDDFFEKYEVAKLVGQPADITFIDGLHLFEYVLRDFRNAEHNSTPDSVILFHDCAPPPEWGERGVRSGDVWKVLLALQEFRPDLSIYTLLAPPSGVGLVRGLDPTNTVLFDRYDEIIERFMPLDYTEALDAHRIPVNPVDTRSWNTVRQCLPSAPYRELSAMDRARAATRRTQASLRRSFKRGVARSKRRAKAVVSRAS